MYGDCGILVDNDKDIYLCLFSRECCCGLLLSSDSGFSETNFPAVIQKGLTDVWLEEVGCKEHPD